MWRSTWRPCFRTMAPHGRSSRVAYRATAKRCLTGQDDSAGGAFTATALKGGVREAGDTLDLIDQLLYVLGPADSGESGFVFFDLDETLITRDTCLIDGLGSTSALMARLEAKLGPSSETLAVIRKEMERDYYSAAPRLVDPLLTRVIRALKVQGHSVFGLTSNALDTVHAPQILETLAKYKIRFSAPEVRGELPKSGAVCLDHPISRGIIFADNQQAITHDKGEIIAEYVGLLRHNARHAVTERVGAAGASGDGGGGGCGGGAARPVTTLAPSSKRPRKCVLVDNTSRKCKRAMETFARHAALAGGGLELHAIHYTEAENLVDSPDALRHLRIILARLRARGLIGVDLVAEDVLVKAPAAPAAGPVSFEPERKGGRSGRGGNKDERLKRD